MENQYDIMELMNRLKRLFDIPECKGDYERGGTPPELKKKILETASCFLCERKNKILIVHHIVPNGEFEVSNLVPMCISCHYWIHRMLHKFKKYKMVPPFGAMI